MTLNSIKALVRRAVLPFFFFSLALAGVTHAQYRLEGDTNSWSSWKGYGAITWRRSAGAYVNGQMKYNVQIRNSSDQSVQVDYCFERGDQQATCAPNSTVAIGPGQSVTLTQWYPFTDDNHNYITANVQLRSPGSALTYSESVNISDWVSDFPIGNTRIIYVRNNSQTRAVQITSLNVYNCVNVMAGACGDSAYGSLILAPGATTMLRNITPSELTQGFSFDYEYTAGFASGKDFRTSNRASVSAPGAPPLTSPATAPGAPPPVAPTEGGGAGDVDAALTAGDKYSAEGKYSEALAAYKQAVSLSPKSPEAHMALGNFYLDMGEYGNAFKPYVQAIRLDASSVEAHYGIGHAYLNVDKPKDAVGFLKSAIRLDPEFAEARYDLGMAYVALGLKGAADKELKALTGLDDHLAGKLAEAIRAGK